MEKRWIPMASLVLNALLRVLLLFQGGRLSALEAAANENHSRTGDLLSDVTRLRDQVDALLPETNVYLDTAFSLGDITPLGDGYYGPSDLPLLREAQFVRMVRAFGARRVLFGTDSPWTGQREELARLRALPLTQEELDDILGENARRLLSL